jgi:nucleoside-diphosphate-sugar epimerase
VAAAALAPGTAGGIVNVGGGKAVHSREVVRLLADLTGFQGAVREDRTPPTRSGAVSWQQADISLAARELGWRPRYTLDEAASELCRSLR